MLLTDTGIIKYISHFFIHQHGDLKPDNIMINGTRTSSGELKNHDIKVIDFSLSENNEPYTTYNHIIVTLPYRAPEIILSRKWDYKIDMVSVLL